MVAELYKLKFLLLIEFFLLILFAAFDAVPFLLFLSLLILLIGLYFIFNSPIIAVHILIFSILADTFRPQQNSSIGPSVSVIEVCFIILLGLFIIKFLFNLDKKFEIPNFIYLWVPFLIWGLIIGFLTSIDQLRVLTYWKNYFAGFFAFCVTYYAIKKKSHVKSVIISVIIWGVILSLLEIKVLYDLGGLTTGIVGLFLKKNLLTLGWGRSNYLAAFFVIIIPITIGYLLYAKSKGIKLLITGALVLMSFALILTLSRGGVLALLITLIILFSKVLKTRTLIPFFAVLLIIVTVLLSNPLTLVLVDRISSLDTSSSFFSRVNYYADVWNAFLNHPITGVGFGNLSYYATFILAADASPSAHNIVLGMLGEIGIVGAIFYFLILGFLLKIVYSEYRREPDQSLKILKWCFLCAVIGGFIHALLEPTLEGLHFSIMFWTIAGTYTKLNLLKFSS